MMLKSCALWTAFLLLTGCSQSAAEAQGGGGGTIDAINHTHRAINHFSINRQSGLDIIGPYQGGGGCCFSMPAEAGHDGAGRLGNRSGIISRFSGFC